MRTVPARKMRGMDGVLVVPIAQCGAYCVHISTGLRFGAVGLVDSKSGGGLGVGSDGKFV